MAVLKKFLLVLVMITASKQTRQVYGPVLNPDCPADLDCSNVKNSTHSANNLIYYVSDSKDDRLHFLISTVDGLSVFFAKGRLDSYLRIDWPQFLARNCSEPCIFIDDDAGQGIGINFAFSIAKLWRYNDLADEVDISKAATVQEIPLNSILWANGTINDGDISVVLRTSDENPNEDVFGSDGHFEFVFQLFTDEDHGPVMPHLMHFDYSSQMDIRLKNLSSFGYNNTRYGLELAFLTSASSLSNETYLKNVPVINDLWTPGTFETDYIRVRKDQSYVLWKPACYYRPERTMTYMSRVYHGELSGADEVYYPQLGLLPLAFYGPDLHGKKVQRFNVSFGSTDDHFYPGYLAWTLIISPGKPFSDKPTIRAFIVFILAGGVIMITLTMQAVYEASKRKCC